MDKFLIASNPNRLANNDEIFIVHCLRPIFLIRVVKWEPDFQHLLENGDGSALCEVPKCSYPVGEPHRVLHKPAEKWILVPTIAGIDIEFFTREYETLSRITLRAVRWFRAYRTQNPHGHEVDPSPHKGTAQTGQNPKL